MSRRNNSYFGYRLDEVSSAAQKAVRRGHTDEAIYWFMEMFWTGAAVKTNIWNRALIMSVEDIGPANVDMLPIVYTMFNNYKDNAMGLAIVANWLAESKKSRVNDWAVKLYRNLDEPQASDAVGTAEEMKEKLIIAMTNKDVATALFYIKALVFCTHKITGKCKNAQWYIWQAFNSVIGSTDPYLNIAQSVAMLPNWRWDKRCRLLHIHVVHLWCNNRWPAQLPQVILPSDKDILRIQKIVQAHLSGESPLEIPDYALDKHTRRGKSMGRGGLKFFIEHGALLNNEDLQWKPISDYYLTFVEL